MDDLTIHCENGSHLACAGALDARGGGFHWWCACLCHPEPPEKASDERVQSMHDKALENWRAARALVEANQP